MSTEIGSVCLSGFDSPSTYNESLVMYLQGLPIYKSNSSSAYGGKGDHVIHLDSSRFFGRLPDRDELVDKTDVLALVKAALRSEIEKRLIEMKSTLSPEVFVAYYDIINDWNLLHLLNDVPVIPRQVLREITCYPNCNDECFGEFESIPEKPVLREEILSGRLVVSFDEDMQDEGSALSMYVFKNEFYVYSNHSKKLDERSLAACIIFAILMSEKVSIELINESHRLIFLVNGLVLIRFFVMLIEFMLAMILLKLMTIPCSTERKQLSLKRMALALFSLSRIHSEMNMISNSRLMKRMSLIFRNLLSRIHLLILLKH